MNNDDKIVNGSDSDGSGPRIGACIALTGVAAIVFGIPIAGCVFLALTIVALAGKGSGDGDGGGGDMAGAS